MDHKVRDTMKRLNALKHQTAQKQKRLEKLQTEYQQMVDDSSEAVATDKGESKDAQVGHHQVQSTTVDLCTEDWSSVIKCYKYLFRSENGTPNFNIYI